MSFFSCYYRKRKYKNIRVLRNMINEARRDIEELEKLVDIYPEQAIPQLERAKSGLSKMYYDISWMMTNYRLEFPKKNVVVN